MTRFVMTAALAMVGSVGLSADVTITQTMTVEGPAAAMMVTTQMPRVVTRIKGMKARTDIDVMGQTFAAISDVTAGHVIVLQSAMKTAVVITPSSVAAGGPTVGVPEMTAMFKPTGQSRTLEGMACDEHSVGIAFNLLDVGAPAQVPPEAAAMMKDVRIVATGSMWFAKAAAGADDFRTFQKAASDSKLMSALSAMAPSPSGGMDKLWAAFQSVPGLPCLSEMDLTFEGTGPLVEVAKQKGPIKVVQRTAAVSTDPLPDDIFVIPSDFKVEKK